MVDPNLGDLVGSLPRLVKVGKLKVQEVLLTRYCEDGGKEDDG
eukprot:CAMPEP_0118658202 /NCGR_PEP_ID=MMETSP0785-20121206/14436_1 /TAXON_ID=91992 /ORGANISM="Bolidomonas pacifica, Strain CCMP 1866" /LENGTH=42 /DNA_ID= /DNA_START= /DNA_END= /DNA_ORIENTATION=